MCLDSVDYRFSGCLHFTVELHEVLGFGRAEHLIGTHADHVVLVFDVAHLAVSPVERHDAAIQILHVETCVRKGVDQCTERRRIWTGGLEEIALQFFPFAECHAIAFLLSVSASRQVQACELYHICTARSRMSRLYIISSCLCKIFHRKYEIIYTKWKMGI